MQLELDKINVVPGEGERFADAAAGEGEDGHGWPVLVGGVTHDGGDLLLIEAPAGGRQDDTTWERSLYLARRTIERRIAEVGPGIEPFFVC